MTKKNEDPDYQPISIGIAKVNDVGNALKTLLGLVLPLLGLPLLFFQFEDEGHLRVQAALCLVNLIIVVAWAVILGLGLYKIGFTDDKSLNRYCDELRIVPRGKRTVRETAEFHNERVNILVDQLKKWVILYAMSLAIVYSAFLFEIYLRLIIKESPNNPGFFYAKVLQDVFNFLSAICLYLGFKILYDRTLDDNNVQSKRTFFIPIATISIFILLYVLGIGSFSSVPGNRGRDKALSEALTDISRVSNQYVGNANNRASDSIKNIQGIAENHSNSTTNFSASNRESPIETLNRIVDETNNYKQKIDDEAKDGMIGAFQLYESKPEIFLPNLVGLFIGCVNALAMFLLFGRYISMEHLINNTKAGRPYTIVTVIVIYILPIYALVQPLFGSFQISAFGNRFGFANFVFAACLVGKFAFLYFTWLYMSNRNMHFYLHSVVSYNGISPEFKNYFKFESQIENIEGNEKTD
jgi:hypothetical protein